jgi:hypothetical protein
MSEFANYDKNIVFNVLTYWELRAENEGTVADLHRESIMSIKDWIKLILCCMKFSALNCRDKRQIEVCIRSDCKFLEVILLDIITCGGDDKRAEFSVCYVMSEFPEVLSYCSYMFTFRYFGWNIEKCMKFCSSKKLQEPLLSNLLFGK